MKKSIAILVFVLLAAGGLFAQTGEGAAKFPMNSITVDAGPALKGSLMGGVLDSVVGSGGGFGIGAQYERHIVRIFSVAARFEYLEVSMSMSEASMKLSSYAIEGHGRLYPFGQTFFLDALAGYAHYSASLSGGGENMNADSDYFKVGGSLGWRIDFGKPGGFIFEPSFGYAVGLGSGSNFGAITTGYEEIDQKFSEVVGGLNELNDMLANYVFVGGPKLSLSLGWRF
jgi:hypothetical protein